MEIDGIVQMAYQPSDMVRGKVANFKIFNSFSSIFRNKAVDEPQVDLLCSFVFFMKIRLKKIPSEMEVARRYNR